MAIPVLKSVQYDVDPSSRIATISLARPKRLNAIDAPRSDALEM